MMRPTCKSPEDVCNGLHRSCMALPSVFQSTMLLLRQQRIENLRTYSSYILLHRFFPSINQHNELLISLAVHYV